MSSLLIQVYWHLSPSCYFLYCYLDRVPQKCILHAGSCLINEHPFQMQEDFRVQTLSRSFSPWSCDVCYIREIFFRKMSLCIQEVKCQNIFRSSFFNLFLQTEMLSMYFGSNITFSFFNSGIKLPVRGENAATKPGQI